MIVVPALQQRTLAWRGGPLFYSRLARGIAAALLLLSVALQCAGFESFREPSGQPVIELPESGLRAGQLAVVYLEGDALSEKIARYYAARRKVPAENIASIALESELGVVEPGLFAVQKKLLDAKLPEAVQAYALAWTKHYRVGCMGITAAFAFGFDAAYCKGCEATPSSRYYNSASTAPYRDTGTRPAMLLAAETFEDAAALVERGIAADDSQPVGAAYLLETSSAARSVRKSLFPQVEKHFANRHRVHVLKQNALKNVDDILFYFTGRAEVKGLDTLRFLPGAMADHLTSYGGKLVGPGHMSIVEWLKAGATGSYGTAVEPCAWIAKFPNPYLAMLHYGRGATLLEAYWKSVQMPGQGNFVGEPLAAPYRGYRLRSDGQGLAVHSPVFRAGRYRIYRVEGGAERAVGEQRLARGEQRIQLPEPAASKYRIERLGN